MTCTWLDICGKSDTHGKTVCHWHVPSCTWRFSPVPGLISMGKVIPMEKGCVIGMYLHVHGDLYLYLA